MTPFLFSDFVFEKSELKKCTHFSLFLSTIENIHVYLYTDERNSEKFIHFGSSDFSKSKSLHRNGDTYEFHANLPIFKKSKSGLNSHQSKHYLTSCLANI